MNTHIPVLEKEVIKYLNPQKNESYIDATFGGGGHSKIILDKIGKKGKVLGIDQNTKSIEIAKKNLKKYLHQLVIVNDNFKNITKIIKNNSFQNASGILYDLGLASWHFEKSGLGISFSHNEKLDMRLGETDKASAWEIVNKFPIKKIADILYQYGDIHKSWSIARRIENARMSKEISTTADLVEAVGTKNPKLLAPIFQAFRIYINNEYTNLEQSLNDIITIMPKDFKIVVISFHSGEDRIVKNIFRDKHKQKKIKVLTKKPIIPKYFEIKSNSKSRSAKLRSAQII